MRQLKNFALCLPALAGGFLLLGGRRLGLCAVASLLGCLLGRFLCAGGLRRGMAVLACTAGIVAGAPGFLSILKQTLLCLAAGQVLPESAGVAWTVLGALLCARRLLCGRVGGWTLTWLLLPTAVCAVTGMGSGVWLYIPGLGLLIVPSHLRALRPEQAGRLTVLLLVPLALLGLAVGVLYPRAGDGGTLRLRLISRGMALFGSEEAFDFLPEPPNVSLRHDAPSDGRRTPVMEVTSARGGSVYLRGRDFDCYTGTDWESTERREQFGGWGEVVDEITVRILGYENYLYLPYYPEENTYLCDGMAVGNRMDYRFFVFDRGTAVSPGTLSSYLRLPERTRLWAYSYLDSAKTAQQIGELVKNSGRYDAATPAMPDGEEDFALWFTQTGQGYCTHFASLAVVLLRAAGIPARYVTGFLVDTEPGQTVTVTRSQAHAWAEYYDVSFGAWRILESTPAACDSEAQADRPIRAAKTVPYEKILVFLPIFALTVVYLQSRIRILSRYRRLRRGSPRQRAYYLHGEAVMLAALLGETPPRYLHDLLQSALYSRIAPGEAELERFRVYCRQCLRRLRRKKLTTRLYHRLYRGTY